MNEVRNLKPNILVIDDEKKMCITLKQLLEKNGFSVSFAYSASESSTMRSSSSR